MIEESEGRAAGERNEYSECLKSVFSSDGRERDISGFEEFSASFPLQSIISPLSYLMRTLSIIYHNSTLSRSLNYTNQYRNIQKENIFYVFCFNLHFKITG